MRSDRLRTRRERKHGPPWQEEEQWRPLQVPLRMMQKATHERLRREGLRERQPELLPLGMRMVPSRLRARLSAYACLW